eukprot:475253-Rhodomonas_salina.2
MATSETSCGVEPGTPASSSSMTTRRSSSSRNASQWRVSASLSAGSDPAAAVGIRDMATSLLSAMASRRSRARSCSPCPRLSLWPSPESLLSSPSSSATRPLPDAKKMSRPSIMTRQHS